MTKKLFNPIFVYDFLFDCHHKCMALPFILCRIVKHCCPEHGVCELAHSFFHIFGKKNLFVSISHNYNELVLHHCRVGLLLSVIFKFPCIIVWSRGMLLIDITVCVQWMLVRDILIYKQICHQIYMTIIINAIKVSIGPNRFQHGLLKC